MDFGLLSPSILVVLSSALTLVGYVLFDALDNGTLRQQSKRTSRYLIFLCYNRNEFIRMKNKKKNEMWDCCRRSSNYMCSHVHFLVSTVLYFYMCSTVPKEKIRGL